MEKVQKIYLISKNYTPNIPGHRSFFSLHGWDVFSIPKIHYDIFKNCNANFFEITKDEAIAFKSFGDCRSTIKVSLQDDEEGDNLYENSSEANKILLNVTETRYKNIIKTMKMFSKILLEEEFNRRYAKLNYDSCKLETRTWEMQIEEIVRYDNGDTNLTLLPKLAKMYKVNLNEMVGIIKNAKIIHDEKVTELYLNLLEIKNKFKNAESISDLSLLYMDYFNVSMPFTTQFKLQRTDLFDENGKYIKPLSIGFNF